VRVAIPKRSVDVDRLARMFKALSNPNRLRLFLNLLDESKLDLAKGRVHDCFLAKLLGGLELGAPTVSHHVKDLSDAGLIRTQREGKQLACSVDPDGLDILREALSVHSSKV
jgi:DNA-binding transcriptional ArsR family regulator